eukprot:SAG25_NODE_1249_length_3494_cov_27.356805_6_plen_67_part_01
MPPLIITSTVCGWAATTASSSCCCAPGSPSVCQPEPLGPRSLPSFSASMAHRLLVIGTHCGYIWVQG